MVEYVLAAWQYVHPTGAKLDLIPAVYKKHFPRGLIVKPILGKYNCMVINLILVPSSIILAVMGKRLDGLEDWLEETA